MNIDQRFKTNPFALKWQAKLNGLQIKKDSGIIKGLNNKLFSLMSVVRNILHKTKAEKRVVI